MKSALITDWLDKYGGAERVLTAICELYSFDYYYAYINIMTPNDLKRVYTKDNVIVTESNVLRRTNKYFRYLMPLFPFIVRLFNIQTKSNHVDFIISLSWALSKGYRQGNEVHICYLQARNFKYIWDDSHLYFKGLLRLLRFLKKYLRKFDIENAQNPEYLISNSMFVRNWVKDKYCRDSEVIYPPVDVEDFYIEMVKEDYYISIGRLEPYKRFDIIVDAFNISEKKLIIIGDGSQLKLLKSKAKGNITFLGYKTKNEMKGILSKAKGFVYGGVEDFGIVMVEALASGVPVIAYDGGASREIIEPFINGILYQPQTSEALNRSINEFEETHSNFSPVKIRESSLRFSKARFKKEFDDYIKSVLQISTTILEYERLKVPEMA